MDSIFHSALKYTDVRDFAYHDKHPLHYGVVDQTPEEQEDQADERQPNTVTDPNDIYRRAVALFDFKAENDNEVDLTEGQVIWASYRHGQGWIVAEILETGQTGLVPEEYVQILPEGDNEWIDT